MFVSNNGNQNTFLVKIDGRRQKRQFMEWLRME